MKSGDRVLVYLNNNYKYAYNSWKTDQNGIENFLIFRFLLKLSTVYVKIIIRRWYWSKSKYNNDFIKNVILVSLPWFLANDILRLSQTLTIALIAHIKSFN